MVKRFNEIRCFHIGTQKAGSTYLYNLLSGHPEAGLAREKEVNFFNIHFDKGLDWYLGQFEENSVIARSGGTKQSRENGTRSPRSLSFARDDSGGGTRSPRSLSFARDDSGSGTGFLSASADRNDKVLIDASPKYFMQGETAAPRIREYADKYLNEEPKFLLILRNPVDYLYSHFKMHLKHGYFRKNPEKFPQVPADITEFVKLYPDYLERGKYYKMLKNYWLPYFDLKQFKIVVFEEFVGNETGSAVGTGSLPANSADKRSARNDKGDSLPEILDWFGLSQKELKAAQTSRNKMLKYNVLFNIQKKVVKHKRLKDALKRNRVFNYVYDKFLTQKDDSKLHNHEREELYKYFEQDISELEELLNRFMDCWKH